MNTGNKEIITRRAGPVPPSRRFLRLVQIPREDGCMTWLGSTEKLRFHGFMLTPTQIQACLDASTRKRGKLAVQYKQRGPFLTDQDFDGISGDLAAWRERWLARVARHG